LENFNTCSLNSGNIDNDPEDELLIGDCQWGTIKAYNSTKVAPTLSWSTSMIEHSSISLTIGDVDNDGLNEVMWGSGITSSGEDVFAVADIVGDTITTWHNSDPSQLDTFTAAGIANITPEEQKAIFIVPKSDSGYNGQRLVTMDFDGEFDISPQISRNWEGGMYGEVVDYDNDGFDEIFLSTAELYDGGFDVLQLNDFSVEWTTGEGEYDDNISVIDAVDLNNDGYADSLYVNGNSVVATDIYNEVLLWNSPSFNQNILDIAAANLDGAGLPEIVIATNTEISIWRKDVDLGTYVRNSSFNLGCSRISISNIDESHEYEIVCLNPANYNDSTSTLTVFDNMLEVKSTFNTPGKITEFIIESTDNTVKNILIAVSKGTSSWDSLSESRVQMISSQSGNLIWSSLPLLGDVQSHSLYYFTDQTNKQRLTFATTDAMYITQ